MFVEMNKFFMGGLILLIALSGCNMSGSGLGIGCTNITKDYTLKDNLIILNSTNASCQFSAMQPRQFNNHSIYENEKKYISAEKALKIDYECMKDIKLNFIPEYPIPYEEVILDKNQNIYGCRYYYGT